LKAAHHQEGGTRPIRKRGLKKKVKDRGGRGGESTGRKKSPPGGGFLSLEHLGGGGGRKRDLLGTVREESPRSRRILGE